MQWIGCIKSAGFSLLRNAVLHSSPCPSIIIVGWKPILWPWILFRCWRVHGHASGVHCHVKAMVKACFAALRQTRSVRRSLSREALLTLIRALIVSKLDYCCSVLAGMSGTLQRRLQSVFNAAAWLVFSARHVTPLLQELHWLKVPERIQFLLCVFVHRCLHGNVPPIHHTLLRLYVWRWITPPSQVWIDIDTTHAVNATSHSRWPCFSSGRCTGLECIGFVGQNIVDVLGVSSPAENTAIQGMLWRPDMIALSICCTALTANFDITFCTVPLQHFLR